MAVEFAAANLGYGRTTVLRDVTFSVAPGEAVALLGGNGAGKSTVLKAPLGLSDVLSGSVAARGGVGYVPQHVDAAPEFPITAQGVVALGLVPRLRPFRRIGREGRRRSREALAGVDLLERSDVRFQDLSGGQRQRVLLARALVSNPEVLLLDEPFNGLDARSRDKLIELLLTLKSGGMAVLLSTHDTRLSDEVCEHTLVVGEGRVTP